GGAARPVHLASFQPENDEVEAVSEYLRVLPRQTLVSSVDGRAPPEAQGLSSEAVLRRHQRRDLTKFQTDCCCARSPFAGDRSTGSREDCRRDYGVVQCERFICAV